MNKDRLQSVMIAELLRQGTDGSYAGDLSGSNLTLDGAFEIGELADAVLRELHGSGYEATMTTHNPDTDTVEIKIINPWIGGTKNK